MTDQELWLWVHYCYGEDLGLTSDDDDYFPPCNADKEQFETWLQSEEIQARSIDISAATSDASINKV